MKPYQQEISDLIRPHLPPDIDKERLRLSILSIFGMTIYFTFARQAISKIVGHGYNRRFKSLLIDHITGFSLDGLNTLEKEK